MVFFKGTAPFYSFSRKHLPNTQIAITIVSTSFFLVKVIFHDRKQLIQSKIETVTHVLFETTIGLWSGIEML